jgi:hypothetical protein
MDDGFKNIELRVPLNRFTSWDHFIETAPEYSIGLEVIDDTPGHRGHYVHFDHHAGVVREATMSAAMQAYIAVRQGRLMEKWLAKRPRIPVYVWNADQDVCLASFILENHRLLEQQECKLLRGIVQFNNFVDVCGGLYPVDLEEMVKNHYTWVFEPYIKQRALGKTASDGTLIISVIRQVCDRLLRLIEGTADIAPIAASPEILYSSPYNFIVADEKGDPNARLVLSAQGHRNFISLVATRPSGRHTYSIIRGSAYDDDTFHIPHLLEAFQSAEDFPHARIWGGSNMAAGSDSELGSSLHWTTLRDIAEPIVKNAFLRRADPLMSRLVSR